MSIWDSKQASRKDRLREKKAQVNFERVAYPEKRIIFCNSRLTKENSSFRGNSISTAKYNIFTFLPKGLFEQFRRVANVYFLLIAILSLTPISPLRPESNIIPLVLVVSVSLVKEAFEDWKRYKHDKQINSSLTEVLQDGKWVTVAWSKLLVGDLVKVKANEYFPADLLFLASTDSNSQCYVETSNLDGESSLKLRSAVLGTRNCIYSIKADLFKGIVKCEQPNESLHTFSAVLIDGEEYIPLSSDQILLRVPKSLAVAVFSLWLNLSAFSSLISFTLVWQVMCHVGCSLRNTDSIIGAVIYAGMESKIMMNTLDVPSKRSRLEKKLDKIIYTLFVFLFVMCLIQAISCCLFMRREIWYLGDWSSVDDQFNLGSGLTTGILLWFELITLYNTLIPISLYVSLEMIKFIQSTQYINKDQNMYHHGSKTYALARTSNLNEELGQIEYIFSDKTGTLTQNIMTFLKCSIGGVVYGVGMPEDEEGEVEGNLGEEVNMFSFTDERLLRGLWKNEPTSDICKEFFRCLALCHSVLPHGEDNMDKIKYEAPSPDEVALVTTAKRFGFLLFRRTSKFVGIREMHVHKQGCAEDVQYEILNMLEFSSSRKRQSVIYRRPNGRIVLYCKGADEVIFQRLSEDGSCVIEKTKEHVKEFAREGLRTLCMAYNELEEEYYQTWNHKLAQARSATVDRDEQISQAYDLIEQKLILLGCAAIEDKLQDGVPECIEMLSRAGIKIWVLTGDKLETAINIAYASKVLDDNMQKLIISSERDTLKVSDQGEKSSEAFADEVGKQLSLFLDRSECSDSEEAKSSFSLIIDGNCLQHALDSKLRSTFLKLCLRCQAVLCCRVTPLQKAQVTALMKHDAKKITLSIGDGANDVSMIQAAHVGVAIKGQEGMQALMASDFAIAQFRFLTDLLLIHGRWSYFRISKVVVYFLYKNIAFTMVQFWFNFFDGFSGQRFYDDWSQTFYNVFFTALPVIVLGLFEKDVNSKLSKDHPELYKSGISNVFFRRRVVFLWVSFAMLHSIIFYYFCAYTGQGSHNSFGKNIDLWDVSTTTLTTVIITVNVRLLMECNILTIWHHVTVWGSIISWFIFMFINSAVSDSWFNERNMVDVIQILGRTWYFWANVILVPVAALLVDFLYTGAQRRLAPYDYQILEEKHVHLAETDFLMRSQSSSRDLKTWLLAENTHAKNSAEECR